MGHHRYRFANSARSCGLLFSDGSPVEMLFGEAVTEICRSISLAEEPVNLLIEAPLSVAFDSRGNPKGRSIEKQSDGGQGTGMSVWGVA